MILNFVYTVNRNEDNAGHRASLETNYISSDEWCQGSDEIRQCSLCLNVKIHSRGNYDLAPLFC